MKILVTGATGYIGGRLIPRLLQLGHEVRILVRDASLVEGRWQGVEIVEGDASDSKCLTQALSKIDVAYYLIHSMLSAGHEFEKRDRDLADLFGQIAKASNVSRIIFLGGLGHESAHLSSHLRSRFQTGDLLRKGGVPVTEFRASMIVGSGSLSFEMLRYLTERIPVMICPRWVSTPTQPIAIRDVLSYLSEALSKPESTGRIFEIGGADQVSFKEMMQRYAKIRQLRRFIIPVPVLTPRLSSLWVNFVTPIPAEIARPLIEGIRSESICREFSAQKVFDIEPVGFDTAIKAALEKLENGDIETLWATSQRASSSPVKVVHLKGEEGFLIEVRKENVQASPEACFSVIQRIGGDAGWPYAHFLWWLRGVLDRLVGGVGLRRGRRSAVSLRVGDVLDFWRVERFDPPRMLRLRAEMKVPGRAWLQFEVRRLSSLESQIIQTAYFNPKGLFGFLYWYILYPFHGIIFGGMIRVLARRAQELSSSKID